MYDFKLTSWRGRFGVTLKQICTGIYVAKETKSRLTIPKHFLPTVLSETVWDFSETTPLKKMNTEFWGKQTDVGWQLFQTLNPDKFATEQNTLCQQYILPKLLPYKKTELPYDLVVHLRGGDVFRAGKPHCAYVQSPISYFQKIIDVEKPKKTLLVCEDKRNPMYELIPDYTDCDVRVAEKLEDDINLILNAKTLVSGGISNFVGWLALCSERLERLYIPEYGKRHQVQGRLHEVFVAKHNNYIQYGKWRVDHKLMATHNKKDIIIDKI